MRTLCTYHRDETFEAARQLHARMKPPASSSGGLQNPHKVDWIPKHPVGRGAFSDRLKNIFWNILLSNQDIPD